MRGRCDDPFADFEEHRGFDIYAADPRNEGIGGDHLVGTSNGVQLRRITYTDPRDGTDN
jgi:hypothetical protein